MFYFMFQGSHASLEHSCSFLESRLETIQPEPSACKTPPLESWLESTLDSSTIDMNEALESLQTAIDDTKTILAIDCGRSLENAKKAIAKAKS